MSKQEQAVRSFARRIASQLWELYRDGGSKKQIMECAASLDRIGEGVEVCEQCMGLGYRGAVRFGGGGRTGVRCSECSGSGLRAAIY